MKQSLSLYLRANACDFALVLVMTLAVGYAVLSGFDASLELRSNLVLQAALAGGLLLVLYAGSWSRKARAASVVGAIAYFLVAVIVSLAIMPEETPSFVEGSLNDVEGNYAIFVVVILVCATLSYVLSRWMAATFALAVAAVFCCGVVQFLFRGWLTDEGGLVDFSIVMVTSIVLIVFRRYRIDLEKADYKEGAAFGGTVAMGVGVSAVCMGVAALVFACCIAPLGLETPILKPFQHRIIPPVIEYSGTYDEYLIEDPNRFTGALNEREEETNRNTEGGQTPEEEEVQASKSPLISLLESITIFSKDDWSESFDATTMDRLGLALLWVVGALLLMALALVVLRIRWRDVRLKRLDRLPASEQVVFLYNFLLSRLAKLGLGKPEASTPLEFAFDSRASLVPFTRRTDKTDFVYVTLAYQRAAYGSGEVTEEDCRRVRRFYRAFFANAHAYLGTPKWLIKFWVI